MKIKILALALLILVNNSLAFQPIGGGGGGSPGTPSNPTLKDVRSNGRIDNGATSTSTAPEWGGDVCRMRIYEDATLGCKLEAVDISSGNVLTRNVEVYSDPFNIITDPTGNRNNCVSVGPSGTLSFDDTAGNCGDIVDVKSIQSGADPADAGVIRLSNDQSICWEASPAGTDVCAKVGIDEVVDFGSAAIKTTGSIRAKVAPRPVTTNPYTMVDDDCGRMIVMQTGSGEVDLLTNMFACMVCFTNQDNVTTLIDPEATDTIVGLDQTGAATTLSAGDRLQMTTQYGQVCLYGLSSTTIVISGATGTLTDAD